MRVRGNTGWWAWAASVALHSALLVWFWNRDDAQSLPSAASAEFIFMEPEAPPPKKSEPASPEEAPAPRPAKRAKRAGEVARPQPEDVPSQPVSANEPGLQDTPRMALSLTPSSSFALALDAGVLLEAPKVSGLAALEAPKDLVRGLAKETLGRGRVDRGLVHPYYSQLGKTLVKNWDADRVAQAGLKGLLEQTQANMKLYNEIWADRAATYGRSGNPMGDVSQTSNRRGPVNDRIQGLPGVDLDQRKELQRQLKEAYKAVRRALIRIVQDSQGKLLQVELVQPSNDSRVDQEALIDVRAAAEKLPPPPPEALEGKQTLSSVWSYELIISISPPVPTFTFEFDEALGFIDTRLPLDRRIYKKVRLVAVE